MSRARGKMLCVEGIAVALVLCAGTAFCDWVDGQNADYVLGQSDFVTNTGTTTSTGLDQAPGVALDATNSKLYVSDFNNNRILRFSYPITQNAQAAELVFGQSDFTSSGSGTTASTFNGPNDLAVDSSGRLWVADFTNCRVLWFNNAHSQGSNGAAADGVLGQADFTSGAPNRGGSVAANTMQGPRSVHVDTTGRLWVVDNYNHRVLWFNGSGSLSNGAAADGVLGQADFVSNSIDRGGTVAANTLHFPFSCAVDSGGRLWIADGLNNRVLRFDSAASLSNGASANGVLGQADFVSESADRGGAAAANTLDEPHGVAVDPAGRLYVSDGHNYRVLVYNGAAGKADGAAADHVIGQPDLTTTTAGLSQSRLNNCFGVALDVSNGRLFVADVSNSRVLQFSSGMQLPVTISRFEAR